MIEYDGLLSLDRMERAVEKVRGRLLRSTAALEAAVMKLTSYGRQKGHVHVLDMIDVGLVDATWPSRYPPELAARLQHLLDTPDGRARSAKTECTVALRGMAAERIASADLFARSLRDLISAGWAGLDGLPAIGVAQATSLKAVVPRGRARRARRQGCR